MTYAVLLRRSPSGTAVYVLREDEVLAGGDGVRYRLVCSTDDAGEAQRAAALVRAQILAGGPGEDTTRLTVGRGLVEHGGPAARVS